MSRALFLALSASVFLLCAVAGAFAAPGSITGRATSSEGVVLPPRAVFEATLEDESATDPAKTTVGRSLRTSLDRLPITFRIPYDTTQIDPRHRYVVRARILVDDEVVLEGDRSHPVITAGNPTRVTIVLRRAGKHEATASSPRIENTQWTLVRLGERIIGLAAGGNRAHLVFESVGSTVSGSTGCNRLSGRYTRRRDRVSFGPLATTGKACPGTSGERELLDAMRNVARWRVVNGQLELLDGAGRHLATFEPGAQARIFGEWRVVSVHAPGLVAAPPEQASVAGTNAAYSAAAASFGRDRCSRPTYTDRRFSAREFAERFRVQPASLSLAEPIETIGVACSAGSVRTAVLILKAPDTVLTPVDSVFLEMRRQPFRP